MHISKYFFDMAKSPVGDLVVGLAFGKFSSLLPVKKIAESDLAVAFWHPKPFWEYHILIVPKAPIKSLLDISDKNSKFLLGVYELLSEVIKQLNWEEEEYSTLINGGKRQEVGQIHLHLFKGKELGALPVTVRQQALDQIVEIYPFLDEKELTDFLTKAKQVQGKSDLETISEYLMMLNNPHADIEEIHKYSQKRYPLLFSRPDNYSKSLPYPTLHNSIMYVDIPRFSDSPEEFSGILKNKVFTNTDKHQGYIFDLRNNGGGNESLGYLIADYFFPDGSYTFGKNKKKSPEGNIFSSEATYTSYTKNPIIKPVVLLVSPSTASSCERFVALMKLLPNVTVIGSETWGGSANPKRVKIKIDTREYTMRIPTWRFYLNGETQPLEITKIKPDVFYDPNSNEIVNYSIEYLLNLRDK